MKKFIAEETFWELFPNAELGIVVVKGINNQLQDESKRNEISKMLSDANVTAKKYLDHDVLSECSAVSVWRDAYQKFKKKKGNRCSIEALLKRVEKGEGVGDINPLVDIYNAMSLTYGLPCGCEDLATIAGDMRLKITDGGDEFRPIGEENDPTLPGELAYVDDKGAVCRCWNWRDGIRTMITDNTKDIFMISESVDPSRHADLEAELNDFAAKTVQYLGGEVAVHVILNKDNRETEL